MGHHLKLGLGGFPVSGPLVLRSVCGGDVRADPGPLLVYLPLTPTLACLPGAPLPSPNDSTWGAEGSPSLEASWGLAN